MRANAEMGKWWESSKIFSKNEWLQHLLCSKPRVWISFHRIKHFNYSMWWEWRWCITSSIHLIWYHFLYRLEHLLSIIFQVLAGSQFFLVGVLCLAFADIYWSTCISQANKQTIEKKNRWEIPLNWGTNSFIVEWFTELLRSLWPASSFTPNHSKLLKYHLFKFCQVFVLFTGFYLISV